MAHIIHKWDESDHAPKPAKEVDLYANESRAQQYLMHQKKWEEGYQQYFSVHAGGRSCEKCSKRGFRAHIPGTHMSPLIAACKHIMEEPPDKPEVVYLFPVGQYNGSSYAAGFYVCEWCKKAIERKRFDFDHHLWVQCWPCLAAHISGLKKLDPRLFQDMSFGKFVAPFLT